MGERETRRATDTAPPPPNTLRSTDKERRMTKVTAKGSAKIADVKSGFEPKLSGSVTLVNALDNGVKVRGVISGKAVKTSSLSGCSLGLEKPGSLSAVYSFDSKTTKVTVFGKSTVQDKAVKKNQLQPEGRRLDWRGHRRSFRQHELDCHVRLEGQVRHHLERLHVVAHRPERRVRLQRQGRIRLCLQGH